MKILFITQNQAPFRIKWLKELSNYFEIEVFHLNEYEKNVNPKYIETYNTNFKITDISKQFLKRKVYDLRRITKSKYDILLLDGYGFFAQQVLMLYLILCKKNFGLSIDGGFIPQKEKKLKYLLKRFYIKHASFYLSTSSETDQFITYYGAAPDKIFRHYFSNYNLEDVITKPLTKIEKVSLRKSMEIDNKYTIVSVGKIIHRKGFDILVKAIKEIRDDLQVYIIGANESDACKLSIFMDKRVHCVSFLSKDELSKYYQAADLFVLPTRKDIWGLVVGEAMANGVEVVSTTMCLAARAMLDEEHIVESENVDALKEIIIKCMKRSEDERLAIMQKNISVAGMYAIENAAKKDYENLRRFLEND